MTQTIAETLFVEIWRFLENGSESENANFLAICQTLIRGTENTDNSLCQIIIVKIIPFRSLFLVYLNKNT